MAAQRLRQLVALRFTPLSARYERLERVERPLEAVDVQNVQLENVAALENRRDVAVLVGHQNRRDVLAFEQEKRWIEQILRSYLAPPKSRTDRKSHLCKDLNLARGSSVGITAQNGQMNTRDIQESHCMWEFRTLGRSTHTIRYDSRGHQWRASGGFDIPTWFAKYQWAMWTACNPKVCV